MKNQFKYFAPVSMIFMVLALADIISVYRLTTIGTLIIPAGAFILPLYYFLEDLIAEVYGYNRFRQVVWTMLIATFIFAIIITFVIHLPVPLSWPYKNDYVEVFGQLFRTVIGGGCIAVMTGAFVNGYIISKWKIIVRGRYFWLRSIGASAVGQLVQIILGCLILYTNVLSIDSILEMIIPIYLIQIGISVLITFPGAFIVALLKKAEGTDVFDYNTNFNPFKFATNDQNSTELNKLSK